MSIIDSAEFAREAMQDAIRAMALARARIGELERALWDIVETSGEQRAIAIARKALGE